QRWTTRNPSALSPVRRPCGSEIQVHGEAIRVRREGRRSLAGGRRTNAPARAPRSSPEEFSASTWLRSYSERGCSVEPVARWIGAHRRPYTSNSGTTKRRRPRRRYRRGSGVPVFCRDVSFHKRMNFESSAGGSAELGPLTPTPPSDWI